jgi:hypothetical protein
MANVYEYAWKKRRSSSLSKPEEGFLTIHIYCVYYVHIREMTNASET